LAQLEMMEKHEQTTIHIDFSHIVAWDEPLASAIAEEHARHEAWLKAGLQEVMREYHAEYFLNQGVEPKEFFVAFFNMPNTLKVRELKMNQLGALVAINGTVTRTSDVVPELLYGRFQCRECDTLSGYIEQQFKFTEPSVCTSATATGSCSNRTRWDLKLDRSRFCDWQRVRVQENADEIPAGSMPRSVDVILRHAAVDRAKAGDKCTFVGSLIVVPDFGQLYKHGSVSTSNSGGAGAGGQGGRRQGTEGIGGLKELGVRDLTYRTAFLAQTVARGSPRNIEGSDDQTAEEDAANNLTEQEKRIFRAMAATPQGGKPTIYSDLVRSLCPTIHGHSDIKKGLLLMLMGGVHKTTPDQIKLRGEINICIVGDPSTAKSQFLKYAIKFQPRAVYTSGKASSAAGLTASVVRDPDSGEFQIEAGALMLADNSICAIDEFDKMDSTDQVAIHEAMEQQTISITKAGIQATLNARTSILAAANPIFGRYDKTKTLRQNVAISPPIMSRFDLFFIVVDEPDEITDENIARHIVNVHQKKEAALRLESDGETHYSMQVLQNYVRYARTINPVLTPDAMAAAVRAYGRLRSDDQVGASRSSYRITVRQLEALLRLSEALARVHLDEFVREKYVLEAYSLLKKSIINVEASDIQFDDEENELGGIAGVEGVSATTAGVDMGNDDDGVLASSSSSSSSSSVRQRDSVMNMDQDGFEEGGGGIVRSISTDENQSSASTSIPSLQNINQNDVTARGGGSGESGVKSIAQPSSKLQIPFEKYERMKKAFLLRLSQQEDEVTQRHLDEDLQSRGASAHVSVSADGTLTLSGSAGTLINRPKREESALSMRQLVNWYLEQHEHTLVDRKAVKMEYKIAKKVLGRMLKVDRQLFHPIDYDAMQPGDPLLPIDEEDRLVTINPL
jgi:DNA replication licensing factor MCM6